ncbi:MAG TPA: hypothetical protein PK544_16015 [Spirochaetota bacterium]|nr:hypothetical protein [Spirochaetota bacterium]HPJ39528.1 hypothetical protein [Spirochaetota bacterium]HPQ52273.1 hypothetical protein [Spirochaetota bacterium]
MMRTILVCFAAAAILSCSTQTTTSVKKQAPGEQHKNPLLSRYSFDIQNTIRIINENNLIETLTHLQKMNGGGSKYYLLERETISQMIKSTSRESYDDLILVNRGGTVIYSMSDHSIFAKNIRFFFITSPLRQCYDISIRGETCVNPSTVAAGSSRFLSVPVTFEESIRGVLIFQLGQGPVSALQAKEVSFDQ